jgi:hypothetical protein
VREDEAVIGYVIVNGAIAGFTCGHVETAGGRAALCAAGSLQLRTNPISLTVNKTRKNWRALLAWTAWGGCPHAGILLPALED